MFEGLHRPVLSGHLMNWYAYEDFAMIIAILGWLNNYRQFRMNAQVKIIRQIPEKDLHYLIQWFLEIPDRFYH
jgi:hypothetical protein